MTEQERILSLLRNIDRRLSKLEELDLTGISDDDHTQYLLATGTRGGATSQDQNFTNGVRIGTGLWVGSTGSAPDTDDVHIDGSIIKSTPLYGRFQYRSAQSIPTATWTSITPLSEISDPAGAFTVSGSQVTPTVAGYYLMIGGITFDANTTGVRQCRALKIGARNFPQQTSDSAISTAWSVLSVGIDLFNGSTDYCELQAYQTSGGNLNSQAASANANYKNTLYMARLT